MRLTILIVASLIFILRLDAKEPFVWYDDEDYKPYVYKDIDGKVKGVFKDLMVEIFKRMDIPLKYDVFPWKRTQKYVKEGKADGMVTVPTKERLKFLYATDPLVITHEKIFTRRDNPRIEEIKKIKNVEQFKGFKVIDYIGAGWAKEHYKGFDVVWAPNQTSVFLMLANKRADIYMANEFIAISNIKKLIREKPQYAKNLKKIIICSNSLIKLDFSLLIRKNSAYSHIIPLFNKTLKEMKKDGTYDKILKKYLTIPKDL